MMFLLVNTMLAYENLLRNLLLKMCLLVVTTTRLYLIVVVCHQILCNLFVCVCVCWRKLLVLRSN